MYIYLVEFIGTLFTSYIILIFGNNWFVTGSSLAIATLFGSYFSTVAAYNPAMPILYLLSGKLSVYQIIPFIGAEILGALVAFFLYTKIYNNK